MRSLLRALSLSARPSTASRAIAALWRDRSGGAPDYHLFWPGARLPGRPLDPDRRLRDIAGGQARDALARGAGDRHRLQRDERPPHRGAQAQARPRQSRGPQLPVERAGELGATLRSDRLHGVLHHLADPDAGLAALRDVLAPDGAMHLMVYAPYGRTGIYMLQEFCRRARHRRHRRGDARSRRGAGGAAARAPAGGAAARGAGLPDTRPRSPTRSCTRRTAPIRCRSYSSSSSEAGLTFGRWLRQAPYSPAAASWRAFPRRRAWPRWRRAEQYAAVELFRGTMVRHSVVVHRTTAEATSQELSFTGDALARLRAAANARDDLRSGAAAARRGRRADQPEPHLPRHLPADRRAREAVARRRRRQTHDQRDRGPGRCTSRPRAPSSSGSIATIRSSSTRRPAQTRRVSRCSGLLSRKMVTS